MYRLAEEAPADGAEVEALFDLCFAPGREALSSYRLREGVAPIADLCLVARDPAGTLAAAIRFWPVQVVREPGGDAGVAGEGGSPNLPALLLGPVAVHPTRQGEGLGALLIREGMVLARPAWERALLVGDAPYYRRFGFERLQGIELPPPTNPLRVLGRALRDGGWTGVRGRVVRWTPQLATSEGAKREEQDRVSG